MEHPSLRCVAQVITRNAHGVQDGGSGYLVASGWVLTAAHVVRGKTAVGVWLGADRTLSPETRLTVDTADILFADEPVDLALLPVASDRTPDGFTPVGFGLLDRDSLQELEIRTLGFPWFKLRELPGRDELGLVREVAAVAGSVIGAGNDKSGTFAVVIPSGPDTPLQSEEPGTAMKQSDGDDTARSVWGGMSGAAVWVAGRLIGVMGQHYIKEGAHTLTAWPLEPANTHRWADPDKVPNLAEPPVVNAPTRRSVVKKRARRAARQWAPERLSDRVAELAQLDAFALGESRWCWIQAPAFAGKTALVAWWTAHHQLDQVDVVACFLRRTTGANTDEDAIGILSEQLAGLANPPRVVEHQRPAAAARIMLDELLPAAAESARESGRRLLMVVDGLDEYTARPGQLPLSDWLPDRETLPEGAALLVTSRKDVPIKVGTHHPLAFHVHSLEKVEIASQIRAAAEGEIKHTLSEPYGLAYRILGFLAAAGGGLTLHDLTDLIQIGEPKVDQPMIETACESNLRRTITGQGPNGAYAFSHDALRAEILRRFPEDNTLRRYRDDLHQWAATFASRGWPADAPDYLVTGYTNMLIDQGDAARLSAYALDQERHRWLEARRGGNDQALSEIQQAAALLAQSVSRDIGTLVLLAFERDRLRQRYASFPATLTAVWTMLGNLQRAETIARSMPVGPELEALAEIARALVAAGRTAEAERIAAEAERVARTITNEFLREGPLAWIAEILAATGRAAEAERLAGTIGSDVPRESALAGIAGALVVTSRPAEAQRIAGSITNESLRVQALARIAQALAETGSTAEAGRIAIEAERITERITEAVARADAGAHVIQAVAALGSNAAARRIAIGAERIARTNTGNSGPDARALIRIAKALAAIGIVGEAERIARTIRDEDMQAQAWAEIAEALSATGNTAEAARFAAEAERIAIEAEPATAVEHVETEAEILAGTVYYQDPRAATLASIAKALAVTGRTADAERMARTITSRFPRARAFAGVAQALAVTGHATEAERIATEAERTAGTSRHQGDRAKVLAAIAQVLARTGRNAEAERTARTITTYFPRENALAGIAKALAVTGNTAEAERIAGTIDLAEARVNALAGIAQAAYGISATAEAQRIAHEAELIAHTVPGNGPRALSLARIAQALAASGSTRKAERIVAAAERVLRTTESDFISAHDLADLAQSVAVVSTANAERIAGTITLDFAQARALIGIAQALTATGHTADAERIAADAERIAFTITDPNIRVQILAGIAEVLAESSHTAEVCRMAGLVELTAGTTILDREQALAQIAPALARTGCTAEAERITATMTMELLQAEALAGIAEALAAMGSTAEAKRMAGTITDELWHAKAFARIAKALAASGNTGQATAVAAETEHIATLMLLTDQWPRAVELLLDGYHMGAVSGPEGGWLNQDVVAELLARERMYPES